MFDFCAIMAYGFMSTGIENCCLQTGGSKKSKQVCFYDDQTLMDLISSFRYKIPLKFTQRMLEIGQRLECKFLFIIMTCCHIVFCSYSATYEASGPGVLFK